MRLKWFLIISCYWITTCLGQYRNSRLSTVPNFGGNRIGHTAINYRSQPVYSSAVLNRPVSSTYYYPVSVNNPNVQRYNTYQITPGFKTYNALHTPRVASAPPLSTIGGPSSFPGVQTFNTMHVPRAASAPPLSSIVGQPTYGKPNPHTIPAQTFRSMPDSVPHKQILQTATRPSRMLLPPSPQKMNADPNIRTGIPYSGRPIRHARYGLPAVKPVNSDEIPGTADNWSAEYDGTYWDSSASHNAPSSSTRTLLFFITSIVIVYSC